MRQPTLPAFALVTTCLLFALTAASSDSNELEYWSWNPRFFQACNVEDDVKGKAVMCYQRYQRDMEQANEDYCCPNWHLADCLIHNVAPGCDEDDRRSLTRYWETFFTNHRDCIEFRYSLDGSMPLRCSWYYHKSTILGWTFGVIFVIVLVTAVTVGIIMWKKRRNAANAANNPSG